MARKRHNHYTDSKRYDVWLERAGEDIISAGLLITDDKCYNAAAFHCQQTIEKSLKAYILLRSDDLVDGHNLTWLCKKAMKYDRSFGVWFEEIASLNRYYIETRYPADIPLDLEYAEIVKCHGIAKDMFLFICGEIDKSLQRNQSHPFQNKSPQL